MTLLERFTRGMEKPGIYHIENELVLRSVQDIFEDQGFNFFALNGQYIADQAAFFSRMAEVCHFDLHPNAGRNAFRDRVLDMPWINADTAQGDVIWYPNAHAFAYNDADSFDYAMWVLQESITLDWQDRHYPRYVFLQGDLYNIPLSVKIMPITLA